MMQIHPDKKHKSSIKRFMTLESEYNIKHNYKYDYSKSIYNGDGEFITIICPIHGEFQQRAGQHLIYGCDQCGVELRGRSLTLLREEVLKRCIDTHGNKFDYSELIYENSKSPITIRCIKHNHTFQQMFSEHVKSKYACVMCREEVTAREMYEGVPTLLYIIKIKDMYKIGITQVSVAARYNKELNDGVIIEELYTKWFQNGYTAYLLEQRVLSETIQYNVGKILSPLLNGGYSELRTINLLEFIRSVDWFEL